jgi:hypothetical protein
VTDGDVATLLAFYEKGRAEKNFDLGIQRALERLLVSPQFLYRIERDPAGSAPGTVHAVSDLELASRLSFFLWSSIPDDELLTVAASGKAETPDVLEQQVKRMLADPRSESMVSNFAAQWLYLRDIDVKRPCSYSRDLMKGCGGLREGNRSVPGKASCEKPQRDGLLTAKYTFVNERSRPNTTAF